MVELIRGKINRITSAPKTNHQRIAGALFANILTSLSYHPCIVFIAPTDVILPVANLKRETATTVVQPDIVVVCDPYIIEDIMYFGVSDWVIEILSPHTSKKNLQLKYDINEETGIGKYWIVMHEQQLIEVFVLMNSEYNRVTTFVK